ncbi:MAG: TIGR04283 family arsenosugar biosynthesis glycosyltransferase [Planctomycetota bacterium]
MRRHSARHVRERLIVFTRYPEPGATKTRLIPLLGPEGAAHLQRRMTAQAVATGRELAQHQPVAIEVRFEGGDRSLMKEWLGPALAYRPQGAGNLGERMSRAFEEALRDGAERVVIAGSDCPGLTARLLAQAFDELRSKDLVLGPARDGGYYLIGLSRVVPELLTDMPWGTGEVLERTLRVAEELALPTAQLTPLNDVDRPEDICHIDAARGLPGCDSPAPRISVIVPALNEAGNIEATLTAAERGRNVEIILVDGGSRDATAELARTRGVCVISGPACRAVQMNLGSAAASGELLLFLHGDTRLPCRFDEHVRAVVADPSVSAGAFELSIDLDGAGMRMHERMINARSRWGRMPYGDQALFLRADLFRRMGGFPEMPIMEDYEMVRRLRRQGRIALISAAVLTSGRRWERLGLLRTVFTNSLLVTAYRIGVSPRRLARWYRGSASCPGSYDGPLQEVKVTQQRLARR